MKKRGRQTAVTLMPAYVRRIEILTQSHRGRGVLSEFTSSAFSAALCEQFPCLAKTGGCHCVWQSHQLSAFQGRALERGGGNAVARLLSRQLMQASVLRIELLTQSRRGRGVLSEFTSSAFSAALCEHFPCSLTLGVWQSHQFSASQGGALE